MTEHSRIRRTTAEKVLEGDRRSLSEIAEVEGIIPDTARAIVELAEMFLAAIEQKGEPLTSDEEDDVIKAFLKRDAPSH